MSSFEETWQILEKEYPKELKTKIGSQHDYLLDSIKTHKEIIATLTDLLKDIKPKKGQKHIE